CRCGCEVVLASCSKTRPTLANSQPPCPATVSESRKVLLFFFETYFGHPYLHSFPTRRSSDLGTMPAMFVATWVAQKPFWSQGKRDRKSTRLNSSHQIISYAVFCLKKKKFHLLAV